MNPQEPYTGHHRANTVPTFWANPNGRRHLERRPGFDWFTLPDHLQTHATPMPLVLPPGELPADSWSEAMVPAAETTGEFDVADLRADWDPVPTGPLRLWEHSGPLPVLPEPRDDDPPSMRWAWAVGVYLLLAFAAALFAVVLAPPT